MLTDKFDKNISIPHHHLQEVYGLLFSLPKANSEWIKIFSSLLFLSSIVNEDEEKGVNVWRKYLNNVEWQINTRGEYAETIIGIRR